MAVPENVPFEKNVYSVLGQSVLQNSVCQLTVGLQCCSSSHSLLIYLVVLPLIESGVLKSPAKIVALFVSVCFIYLGVLLFVLYVYNCYIFLVN